MNALNYLYRGVYSYFSQPLGGGEFSPGTKNSERRELRRRKK